MGLAFNGHRHIPYGRVIGATNIDGGNRFTQMGNASNTALWRNELLSMNDRASVPDGCRHPVAWVMPRKAGGLSTRNNIIGAGGLTLSIQQARDAQALLVGQGGVLSPVAGLVVQVAALLLGAGGIVPPSPQLIANLTAVLLGSGGTNATAAGLADLSALLAGSGGVLPNNTALANLSATLRGYGELTPEGLRDAVWNSLATQYNSAGTMGEKVNDAGSASNPWTEVIESGYTAAEILRLLAAVAAGDASGLATNPSFTGLDGSTTRVAGTIAGANRTITTIDGS